MNTSTFKDFHIPITAVDRKNYQQNAKVPNKSKYTLPLTLIGTVTGGIVPTLNASKNLNMQYAFFVKEKLKPLMTSEFDKIHRYPHVPRFSKNPITHIKEIKYGLKCCEEDIISFKQLINKSTNSNTKLNLEIKLLGLQKRKCVFEMALVEYKNLFADINLEFKTLLYNKITKKMLSCILILSTIGTIAGLGLDKIAPKRTVAK